MKNDTKMTEDTDVEPSEVPHETSRVEGRQAADDSLTLFERGNPAAWISSDVSTPIRQ